MPRVWNKQVISNLKEFGPAIPVLLVTLIISSFITEFAYSFGPEALWRTLFRFLRFSFLLVFPLFFLPKLCGVLGGLFHLGSRTLIQIPANRDPAFHAAKHWLIRPLQGIGLCFLVATKLLAFLQIYSGSGITVGTIVPPEAFNLGRFFTVTTIVIMVSLLLSFLWAVDDLGVRLYNRKSREVRLIGKYIGILLPILFGFYGIVGLFENYLRLQVALYVAQMVVVLYPPFVVLTVIHSKFIRKREERILERLNTTPAEILVDGKNSTTP